MGEWELDEQYIDTWFICKKFGTCNYKLTVYVEVLNKSVKYNIGLSSGRKRSDLDIYENKDVKSDGGISALLWAVNTAMSFPELFKEKRSNFISKKIKNHYLCINWADSRRRDIYARLNKYGFKFMNFNNEKTLIKKI